MFVNVRLSEFRGGREKDNKETSNRVSFKLNDVVLGVSFN